jgi:MFS family permease
LANRRLWPVWLATFVFGGNVIIFMSFVTVTASDRGIDNTGVIWLTYALGAVSVRLFGARLPDQIGPSTLVIPAIGTYALGTAVAAGAHTPNAFIIAGLLAGLGHGYAFPVLAAQVVNRSPEALRGSAMSAYTGFWDLSRLAVAPLFGQLADQTSDTVMLRTAAATVAVGLVAWVALERGQTE